MKWDVGFALRKRAMITPEKTAFIYEDQSVTYKELNNNTNRCVRLFQDMGLKKGDRISVDLLNCPEFLEVYFAAAKLGLIFVPLNWRMVGPELEYQLNDCGSRLLVFHDSFLNYIDSIRSNIKVDQDKFIYLKSGTPNQPECPDWARDYYDIVKNYPVDEPEIDDPVDLDDSLAIVYTSGVTGDPKGAILSHMQTYFKIFQIGMYMDSNTNDVILAQLPLFHSGGLFIVATPAICGGTNMILRRGFDPNEFAEDIERYKATIVFGLTTMWRLILDSGKLDSVDMSSVRVVVGGGERTPPSLFEELEKRGLHMQQGFGQTENSAMMMMPREDIKRKMGSIGKPGFFTHIWIADSQGNEIPKGQIGEIVAKGPTVMSGYWNKPEQTAETIVNEVLFTGDLGYEDNEGFFYIVDRAKDMYRSGGENVYPAEVEKVLSGHPKIANVSIIGVPDDKWGEAGMAFIIPAWGAEIKEEEVYEYLGGKIAKYKYPKHIKFMGELPMTATMKIKKSDLKKEYGVKF